MSAAPVASRWRTATTRVALVAFVLSLLVMLAGPALRAGAADEDQTLSIRKVDSIDPAAVKVSLIYNGPRKDLSSLTLRENGQVVTTKPVVPLSKAGVETAVVFVVDASRSMVTNGGLNQAKASMRKVVEELGDGSAVGLVVYGTDATVLQELTTSRTTALKAIDDLAPPSQGRTAMWDGVKQGAALFSSEPALQPNLVLISDGADDSSEATQSQATTEVTRSGAAVFALAYNEENQADQGALNALVDAAGGRLFTAPRSADLATSLDTVRQSLENQFVVEYASKAVQGSTDLEITVAGHTDAKSFVPGSVAQGKSALKAPTVGGSPLPDVFTSGVGRILALGAVALAVAMAFYAVALLSTKDESGLDNVLMPYTDGGFTGEESADDGAMAQTAILQRAVDFTEDFAERQGFLEKMEIKLEQANLPLRAAEFIFFWAAGVLVLGMAIMLLKGLFVGLIGFLVLGFLPKVVLNFLASRRQKQFNAQLPDMLQLLSGSLRAGYSLIQGVEAVSSEIAEPMGKELRRVCTEARLGRELEEALDGVGQRMNSADFEWAVMAVRIQREVGGNLSELLLTVGETMVSRERMRREVAALTAEGKISAIVLGILPPGLGLVMYVVNPNYMGVLFTETVGQVALAIGVVLMLVGFAWMKKCITIEI